MAVISVKVLYSSRRKRTVSAKLNGDVLLVMAPAAINKHRLEKIVDEFKDRFERKRVKDDLRKDRSLQEVAFRINKKYFGNTLKSFSIEYSTRQNRRYGSCQPHAREIKISARLKEMPEWVRDYVVVHEMAHLVEPNHGRAFHEIVNRYKLAERARGYLMAAGFYGKK